jgi:NAD(P)-dependent dehydrogenase (short-subunit alcohol dehydrogenase family)
MVGMPVGIVTGASRGLGLALTRALDERGWRLVVDARGRDALAAATAELSNVTALPGDVADEEHRRELVEAAGERIDLVVNNAGLLGLLQLALPRITEGAAVLDITSDAALEAYEGWGGYGSSKAALEQLTAVLAAEQPGLRVYWVDPGDMRTRMHQDAFPGEDISDRPQPEESVPGLLTLIEGSLPSGRYRTSELAGVTR